MDAILSDVQAKILVLARQRSNDPNVTLSLVADFKNALFPLLDERTRIKDLENSPELAKDMIQLSKLEDHTTMQSSCVYLGQTGLKDKCYAQKSCKFALGQKIYKSACKHWMCKDHKESACLGKHDDEKHSSEGESAIKPFAAKVSPFTPKKFPFAAKNPQFTHGLDTKKADAKKADEEKTDDKKADGKKADGKKADGKKADEEKADEKKADEEKADKVWVTPPEEKQKKGSTPKLVVEHCTVKDLEFNQVRPLEETQICQVEDKNRGRVWILLDDYIALKAEYAKLKAEEDAAEL